MFAFFKKNYLAALLAYISIHIISPSLWAQECCYSACDRWYVGAFGGGIHSNAPQIIQRGTAFLESGILAVDARGYTGSNWSGFGGLQVGYEWAPCPFAIGCADANIASAIEVEAYWYRYKKQGDMINPTLEEHDFIDTFPMNFGVYLLNGVCTFHNRSLGKFSPYLGGGIGVAHIYIHNASSIQVSPAEPEDHFNSDRSDRSWAFAAQAKAGFRYNICHRIHPFAEYRFLYVDSSRYIFGSTIYDTHAPTTTWIVDVKHIYHNAFVFGLQFDL